jgi:hypothetical protein
MFRNCKNKYMYNDLYLHLIFIINKTYNIHVGKNKISKELSKNLFFHIILKISC